MPLQKIMQPSASIVSKDGRSALTAATRVEMDYANVYSPEGCFDAKSKDQPILENIIDQLNLASAEL